MDGEILQLMVDKHMIHAWKAHGLHFDNLKKKLSNLQKYYYLLQNKVS